MSDNELKELLLKEAKAAGIMAWLAAEDRSEEDRKAAVNCLAQMHHEGRLNVLRHLGRPKGVEEWRLDYGRWSQAYRELVPALDDEATNIVSAIVEFATGTWEHILQESFLEWCSRALGRIDAVLALGGDHGIPDFCFAAALVAGMRMAPTAYVAIAADYVLGAGSSRMPGIRAMGAMSTDDAETVRRALSCLGELLNDPGAPIRDRVDALNAALEIAHRNAGPADGFVADIASQATATGKLEFLQTCCHALVRFGSAVRPTVVEQLLAALQDLDIDTPENQRTIDSTLRSLMVSGRRDEALECLEAMLRKSRGEDPLDNLEATTQYLALSIRLMPIVVTRWLMTGERPLCVAARRLLTSAQNQKFIFDFDPGNQAWTEIQTIYLARKAIGWLMPHSTGPASLLVCLLRNANSVVGKELGDLLFDPLLINYPLATRSYLDAVLASLPDAAKCRVEEVLARDDSYKQAIDAVGYIPELQPTEHHRWIEHRRQEEEWAKARKKAESKSVLSQLVPRQTMLYGTHSIDYVQDKRGSLQRLDNRLTKIIYTTDNVMGWVFDPCGLDFVLRKLRVEQKPE